MYNASHPRALDSADVFTVAKSKLHQLLQNHNKTVCVLQAKHKQNAS